MKNGIEKFEKIAGGAALPKLGEWLTAQCRESLGTTKVHDKDTKIKRLEAIIGMQEALLKKFYMRKDVHHACAYYNIQGQSHEARVLLSKKQDELLWCLLEIVRDNLIKDPTFNHDTFVRSKMYRDYLSIYNSYSSFLLTEGADVLGRYPFEKRESIDQETNNTIGKNNE